MAANIGLMNLKRIWLQEYAPWINCSKDSATKINGVAECMNRTLVEMARSMLIGANMPQRFWAEAISTAAYLRNWSPTEAKTPYETWTGDKQCVDWLRIFGCQAFLHIPKDERKKLESKSRKCILLEYGRATKVYRLYYPLKKKVFFSRVTIFNEEQCGLRDLFQTQSEPCMVTCLSWALRWVFRDKWTACTCDLTDSGKICANITAVWVHRDRGAMYISSVMLWVY